MYAVVNIAGHQVKVDKGLRLRVPRLQVEQGSTQEFTEVLLVADEGETKVGNPTVEGASVSATAAATRSSSSRRRSARNIVGAMAIARITPRFRWRTSSSRTKRERTRYHGS